MQTRIATAMSYVRLANDAYGYYRAGRAWWNDRNTYIVTVPDGGYVYPKLTEWVAQQTASKRLAVISKHDELKMLHDETASKTVHIGEHEAIVWIEGGKPSASIEYTAYGTLSNGKSLVFSVKSQEALNAVDNLLKELTEEIKKSARKASLMNLATYGWEDADLPVRAMESVIMPHGVKEDLLADIEEFLKNESRYVHMGLPWHRGYLLHGEPGNGKTSIISAIANHLNVNLYNLQLSAVSSDRQLMDLFQSVSKSSVMVIEDIDIFSSARSREGDEKKVTLAGLLNCLDGISTPHGLLTFITTNRIDSLEPALIRPGRIDYRVEFKAPDEFQVDTMFRHVYAQSLGVTPREFASMAELTDIFKRNLDSPDAARAEILALDPAPVAV